LFGFIFLERATSSTRVVVRKKKRDDARAILA